MLNSHRQNINEIVNITRNVNLLGNMIGDGVDWEY